MAGSTKAWFFGTEPPTPAATWGSGGVNRKVVVGAVVAILILVLGSGAALSATGTSFGGSGWGANSSNQSEPNTADTATAGSAATGDGGAGAASPSASTYYFPEDIGSPTATAGPYTGDSALLGVWVGTEDCNAGEVGMMLELSGSVGDYVNGYWAEYAISGGAQIASTGAVMLGLDQGIHLSAQGQSGYFYATLGADGQTLSGTMTGCGSTPVSLQQQALQTGADDPLVGTWSDAKGDRWTISSTGPGQYTGVPAHISTCAYVYTLKLTGYNGHYVGSATPSSNSGCTIPIFSDDATLDISSGDASAALVFDGETTVILAKGGAPVAGPSGSSSPGAASGSASASPSASASTSASADPNASAAGTPTPSAG
ncbi:hypothetical protein KDL01_13175 [Actinospica durhamensis]|uniref:Uncharacterized protein n=1 Tax=Actinospica durhamensis TaxID=1508375 RepID=A0A941ENB9_9ACTN|nr:hypothetical protein [Actinospica durhamensis]MBR7834220.1 hypothetical protein [Actinospica durhamensis]